MKTTTILRPATILFLAFCIILFSAFSCNRDDVVAPVDEVPCDHSDFIFTEEMSCFGDLYPDPLNSDYILPVPIGKEFRTGLCNCSSSFHALGNPDQHAFDFDLEEDSEFIAARAGTVVKIVQNQSSDGGGGAGNYVIVDHTDNTYGLYYHAPERGIDVNVGDEVKQGQVLGKVGRSGLAGYPHLHFIVVKDDFDYPYEGVLVNFRNLSPMDLTARTNTTYTACQN